MQSSFISDKQQHNLISHISLNDPVRAGTQRPLISPRDHTLDVLRATHVSIEGDYHLQMLSWVLAAFYIQTGPTHMIPGPYGQYGPQ